LLKLESSRVGPSVQQSNAAFCCERSNKIAVNEAAIAA
jgi:hypothetical protein